MKSRCQKDITLLLIVILISFCFNGIYVSANIQSFDGLFNNPVYPTWGYEGTGITRFTFPMYEDGVYLPVTTNRPNARVLSNVVFKQYDVTSPIESQRDLTALFTMFGQKLVQEVTESVAISHPPEYFSIPTGNDDDVFAGVTMPMVRSEYAEGSGRNINHPREIINEVTPFIDLANVYGPNEPWNEVLRTHENGHMFLTEEGLPPFNEAGLPMTNPGAPVYHLGQNNFIVPDNRDNFLFGNPRASENPAVFALHVIWLREHNRMADELRQQNPDMNDFELFHRARQFTIARYQHIVFNEWLPLFLNDANPLPTYNGYDVHLHPQVMIEFSTVAMRFGHSLVPFGFLSTLQDGNIRLCNSFFNTREEIANQGNRIENLISGLGNQKTEAGDRFVVEDLRSFLFGGPELSRRDLIAINIQRGRDHGVPDYNTLRVAFGQQPITDFSELTSNITIANMLRELHNGDINSIDAFVGGMLETDEVNGDLGSLFRSIITEQFRRFRDADRFYYRNLDNGIFDLNDINLIEQDTFADIINRNTDNVNIQNAFVNPNANSFVPVNGNNDCTPPSSHDFSITQRYHVTIYVILLIAMLMITFFIIKRATVKKIKNKDIENRETVTLNNITRLGKSLKYNESKNKRLHIIYEYFGTDMNEFYTRYKELLKYLEIDVEDDVLRNMVKRLFNKYSLSSSSTFEDFKDVITELTIRLKKGTIGEEDRDKNFISNTVSSSKVKSMMYDSKKFIWFILYICFTILVFIERSYVYRYEREHTGFRIVTNGGVVVTRGAASVISFTMALLPLTMAKNLITKLSNTFVSRVIPFEYMNDFHKLLGHTFTIFTTVHIIGHAFNFYYISSLHPRDANAIFEEIYILSHELPTFFGFWIFRTVTGFTGFLLVVVVIFMIPFTIKKVRNSSYELFWYTHKLYIPLYILTILHGSAQLIQAPLFWHYVTASILIFGLDRMLRTPVLTKEVKVINVIKKPSDVVQLILEKPKGFNYEPGQWCYLLRSEKNIFRQVRHPFTITTAPCERRLGFHIKMQCKGSWTNDLLDKPPNTLRLDGPFGITYSNYQNDYNVIVLIGGGVGITPFASILKDLVFKANLRKKKFDSLGLSEIKKVYLFWTSKTVRSFEWFSELLNELQEDLFGLSIYQFITGDVTSDLHNVAMLLGEISHRSITKTSLISKNRWNMSFGRPDIDMMFSRLEDIYKKDNIGVFSCGSSHFNEAISNVANKHRFDHYSESF